MKHDKIVLLANSQLNSIEVLITKALIDSNISLDEFDLINNVPKTYDDIKEEIKNLKISSSFGLISLAKVFDCTRQFIENFSLFVKQWHCIV